MSTRFFRRFTVRASFAGAVGLAAVTLHRNWDLHSSNVIQTPPAAQRQSAQRRAKEERQDTFDRLAASSSSSSSSSYDVLVVGGGVIGLYAAVDAAQRGLRVALVEAKGFGDSPTCNTPGLMPCGVAACQRAVRQRHFGSFAHAVEANDDAKVWCNVLPEAVVPTVLTMLPMLHSANVWEMRLAAFIDTVIGPWSGLWRRHHLFVSPSDVASVLGSGDAEPPRVVMVKDSAIDPVAASIALARTAKELGVDLLNYAAVVRIAEADEAVGCPSVGQDGGEDALSRGTAPLRGPLQVTVQDTLLLHHEPTTNKATKGPLPQRKVTAHAKVVVNATGPWLDTIRQYDQATSTTAQHVFHRFFTTSWFVVPRRALQPVASSSSSSSSALSKPLQSTQLATRFFGSGSTPTESAAEQAHPSPSVSNGPPLGLLVNSSLRSFASVMVLPFFAGREEERDDDDALSDLLFVGTTSTPLAAPPSVLPVHSNDGAASTAALSSTAQPLHQQEGFTEALRQLRAHLRTVGLSLRSTKEVRAAMSTITPILSDPVGWETEATLLMQSGFHILTHAPQQQHDGDGGRMVHVVGGTVANARRVGSAAIDAAVRLLLAQHPSSIPTPASYRTPSATKYLRLFGAAPPSSTSSRSARDEVAWMVQERFVRSSRDALRDTKALLLDPEGAWRSVPLLSKWIGEELGWSTRQVQADIAATRAMLQQGAL